MTTNNYWRFYFSGHLDFEYIPKLSDNFQDDFEKSYVSHINDPCYSVSIVDSDEFELEASRKEEDAESLWESKQNTSYFL